MSPETSTALSSLATQKPPVRTGRMRERFGWLISPSLIEAVDLSAAGPALYVQRRSSVGDHSVSIRPALLQ